MYKAEFNIMMKKHYSVHGFKDLKHQRKRYPPVFSKRVLGAFTRFMMVINCSKIKDTYGSIPAPRQVQNITEQTSLSVEFTRTWKKRNTSRTQGSKTDENVNIYMSQTHAHNLNSYKKSEPPSTSVSNIRGDKKADAAGTVTCTIIWPQG